MSERNMRKTVVGKVVSDKMDKTIVVAVEDSVKHKLYNKIVSVQFVSRHTTKTTSVALATV